MVRPLFGRLRPDGRRQFTKAFWAMPRKQGKTELAAGVILYLLLGTGKRDQQLYSASGDHEQAALLYRAAATMIRNDPELDAVCQCYDGFKRIKCEPLGSFYDALSSDAATKHGKNPSAVVFDELHVFPNRDLFNALTTGFATRREPLTLMITTAGFDRTSLCYEQWRYAEDVRDGIIDDPEFQAVIHAAKDRIDDPKEVEWTTEATWHKAMPGLGDFCSTDWVRSQCRQAQQLPSHENAFKQLQLNIWTEQATRWIPVEAWAACNKPIDYADLIGKPCYAGLDMGLSGDMSALARVFVDDDGGITILMNYWSPKNGKWRDELRNTDRYELWAKQGFLTLTEDKTLSNTRDSQKIEDDIIRLDEETPMRLLLADRAYASEIISRLYNVRGFGDRIKGIGQGAVMMNEPTVKFEELVLSRRVRHDNNPILAWNVANAVLVRLNTGLVHLDKGGADTERVDGLAAVLDALRAMCDDPSDTSESVYESRGLIWL